MKVNRNLNLNVIFFFCHQKTIKNRQALHEIIRALSLSINFAERSFKPVYPTMVVKSFKFMENYNSWKIYSQVKILTLDIFTHMLLPPPPLPPTPPNLHPCSLRRPWLGILGYFIWFVVFSNVMTLQFCKYIAFCHIAW